MNSKQLMGAGILAIAGLLAFAWAYPTYKKIAAAKEAIVIREQVLAERTQIIENVEALSKEYERRSNEVSKFSQVLPGKKNLAELIASVEAMATRSGVVVSEFKISDAKAAEGEPVTKIEISFKIDASYEALIGFLNNIEKNIRILDINTIDIGSKEGINILNISLKGNTYIIK